MKKRHTDEQIICILREAESQEVPVKDLCKRHNISEQTFYRWRTKFGGMDVAEARRLKELESENEKLKRLVAEQLLVIDGLKEFSRKNEFPDGPARSAGSPDSAGIIATQGMSLPGAEPPGGDLHAQATGERPELGRAVDRGLPRGATLRLSSDLGLAVVGRIACAPDVACAEAEHPEAPAASTALRQRYSPAGCDETQFGLELRLRPRPVGRRSSLEDAVRDRRIHPRMPSNRGRGQLAFARRDPDLPPVLVRTAVRVRG